MRSIGEGGHRDWCYDGRTDAALEMVTGMVTDILFRLLLLLSIFFMLTFLFFLVELDYFAKNSNGFMLTHCLNLIPWTCETVGRLV